jgi:hypothetical protein
VQPPPELQEYSDQEKWARDVAEMEAAVAEREALVREYKEARRLEREGEGQPRVTHHYRQVVI